MLLVAVTILLIIFNLQFRRIGRPGSSFDYILSGTGMQEQNVCYVNVVTNFDAKLAVGMLFGCGYFLFGLLCLVDRGHAM